MSIRWVLVGAIVIALAGGSSAYAQTTSTAQTITATGFGQARVRPVNRHNNASIAAAYDKARQVAIGLALSQAQEYAAEYAQGTGMTLGSPIAVSDETTNQFAYGIGINGGTFGPGKFCGTERVPVFKKVNGKRKLVRLKKEHRCITPSYAYATLVVTYSASSG
jgi:hypothetical protein